MDLFYNAYVTKQAAVIFVFLIYILPRVTLYTQPNRAAVKVPLLINLPLISACLEPCVVEFG